MTRGEQIRVLTFKPVLRSLWLLWAIMDRQNLGLRGGRADFREVLRSAAEQVGVSSFPLNAEIEQNTRLRQASSNCLLYCSRFVVMSMRADLVSSNKTMLTLGDGNVYTSTACSVVCKPSQEDLSLTKQALLHKHEALMLTSFGKVTKSHRFSISPALHFLLWSRY